MTYLAQNLSTALGEVFAPLAEAVICPQYRVALVRPTSPISVLDLRGEGAAMKIGALPALSMGDCGRQLSQQWARAIYEDRGVVVKDTTVHGVYYGTGHTGGGALALWGTAGPIELVTDSTGHPQDFALDGATRSRVVTELDEINIYPTFITSADCPECQKTM